MSINLKQLKRLPDAPGVYFFKRGKHILYIGKATSLKDRVRSYFSSDLLKTRSQLIADMAELSDTLDFQKTDSVLEALLLEAELIKKHQPKYNTKEKDNKSFNFVVITKEDFPQILVVRGRDLEHKKASGELKIKSQFGPFSNGQSLKEALKIIRKIFPYRDYKCKAGSGKPCFNYQIGLCPGTCINTISKSDYGRIIRHITLFFQGKKSELVRTLKKEMKDLGKELRFEEAAKIKRQIFALEHIRDVSLIKDDFRNSGGGSPSMKPFRIEAYDVAHTQGTNTTGVMVVVEDGISKKSDYRMFKIRRQGINDVASLEEILTRRLGHPEWPLPDLIVVDGGIAQLNKAQLVLDKNNLNIDLVAVVKDERHKPREILGKKVPATHHQKAILLANSEAHRFTLKYHRKKRSEEMFR